MVFVLVGIAITQGVPQQSSEAPHKRVAAHRAKETRSAVWRRAALVGLFVFLTGCSVLTGILGFQLAEYGYLPNAVPMEGGMCQ